MIKDNLERIREKIKSICGKLNRNTEDIVLVCVTKGRSIEEMLEAINAGIADIGENRAQEALSKFEKVNAKAYVRWNMIGHLQTNKTKQALKIFAMIHSVDSRRLAKEIDKEVQKLKKKMDILIQVNTSKEATKFGVKIEDTLGLIDETSKLKNLQIRGLMTMAPLVDNPEDARSCFRSLRILRDKIALEFPGNSNVKMDYLSMGMSQDYEVAVEEGANMLRIGRAIFE